MEPGSIQIYFDVTKYLKEPNSPSLYKHAPTSSLLQEEQTLDLKYRPLKVFKRLGTGIIHFQGNTVTVFSFCLELETRISAGDWQSARAVTLTVNTCHSGHLMIRCWRASPDSFQCGGGAAALSSSWTARSHRCLWNSHGKVIYVFVFMSTN